MAVLCDIFEELVASLVVSWHLGGGETNQQIRGLPIPQSSTSKRRFVTLPRNWCLAALRHRMANRPNSAAHLGRLARAGSSFISQILEPQPTRSGQCELCGTELELMLCQPCTTVECERLLLLPTS